MSAREPGRKFPSDAGSFASNAAGPERTEFAPGALQPLRHSGP